VIIASLARFRQETPPAMLWVQFAICSTLIVVVGSLLSRYADMLAEKTGLGRSWVGGILLAGTTSLPELATGLSAVLIVDDVNLAAGGILGSCLFNLCLIALLDVLAGETPVLKRAEISHILAASLGCVMLSLVMIGLYLTQSLALPALGWIGLPSLAILAVYFVSVRIISSFERHRMQEVLAREAIVYQYAAVPTWRAALSFGLCAAAIVGLGLWLAALGEEIALTTGLGASFVGAIFLAVTTSLPEVVASLAAMRLGAVDLAVANIFGSNIFNIFVLAIYDLAYRSGSIWAQLAPVHAFAAVASTLMTALTIIGLIYQSRRRPRWFVSWDAALLVALYLGSMGVIYLGPR
jgi:cation:H+ antiporter